MTRSTWLVIVCCSLCITSRAQYFNYSQYNFTTQRVNPAMTGLTRYATAGTSYRHQQTGGDFSINSNFVSLSYPLLNSSTGVPWSGIALSLHNDQAASIFKTQEVAVGYAIHVRVSRYQTFSFGAKALYQARKIGLDGFYTGSQYVPDRGFDPGRSSGESFSEQRSSSKTFGAGLYWQEVDKKGRLRHHFGASLFDVNSAVLPKTFIVNAGFETYSTAGFHVIPEGLLTVSGGAAMFNGGFRFQKEINVTAKKPSDLVDVLLKYAVGRSGIAGIQFHRENISLGLSYDFPLFRQNPGNLGALEFGLELRRLVSTRAQKAIAKRKKAAEEKQALAKKGSVESKQKKADSSQNSVDSVKQEVVQKSVEIDSVKSVPAQVISPGDTTLTIATAKAGKLKQEPMVIEHVTLHFAFEFNSSDLDEPTETFLDQLAETLRQDESLQLNIEGHTDNIGTDKFNLRLSQKRAEVVKALLIKKGIAAERLHAEGKGMHEPLNQNLTDEERAKNRRVEITVFY
jgi:type IX secretion system PorP/SprF family membrane protein